jgi:hypothetical protein
MYFHSLLSCAGNLVLQIGESLKRFGATESTKHLLVARFDATPEDVSTQQLRASTSNSIAGNAVVKGVLKAYNCYQLTLL